MQVGIIGGGQLAMMLCQAATKLNIETVVLDPNPECSCQKFATRLITCDYDDLSGLEELAKCCDVVTYEFENVDVKGIDQINSIYHNVIQTSKPLVLSNDRLIEKTNAKASGFMPAEFSAVSDSLELGLFIQNHQLPVVVKTRRFGYDGKGQVVISDIAQIESDETLQILDQSAIVEKMIDLDYETSVIAVRNQQGEMQVIPSTINEHRNNILYKTTTMEAKLDQRIYQLCKQYLDYHNLIGIITFEVFVSKDGQIYFNEIAPRPHNSGHYSIEGCNHSQFEMHLRAICGMELPTVEVLDTTVMINVLGQDYERALEFIATHNCDQLYFHDYFKSGALANRKMAHITAVGAEAIKLLSEFEQ